MRISKTIFMSLSIALLCIGSAKMAHADVITFIGSRDFTGGQSGVPNPTRCGPAPPNILVTEPTGTGTSTLGSFTSTENHCLNVATGNFSDGRFTFDFGGGNSFFGTYLGTIALPLPPPTGVAAVSFSYTLTGGTGLYAGATGVLMASGTTTFTPTGRNSHIDISGTINTIPEPATLVLLGSGLAGIGAAARKRRKSPRDQAG